MQFTDNEIATYLFCAKLPQTKTNPLTILEWNTVVKSLDQLNMQPEILFNIPLVELENLLINATEAQKRRILNKVEARQKLGMSMVELKEMTQQGFRIMFRAK